MKMMNFQQLWEKWTFKKAGSTLGTGSRYFLKIRLKKQMWRFIKRTKTSELLPVNQIDKKIWCGNSNTAVFVIRQIIEKSMEYRSSVL